MSDVPESVILRALIALERIDEAHRSTVDALKTDAEAQRVQAKQEHDRAQAEAAKSFEPLQRILQYQNNQFKRHSLPVPSLDKFPSPAQTQPVQEALSEALQRFATCDRRLSQAWHEYSNAVERANRRRALIQLAILILLATVLIMAISVAPLITTTP